MAYYSTVNEIFKEVREMLGGWEEAELDVRFPDTRLWPGYKQFKGLLADFYHLDNLSVSSVTIQAGTNSVSLGNGERRIAGAFRTETDGTLTRITPMTRELLIASDGLLGTDTGTPSYYWVEPALAAEKSGTCTVVHTSSVYSTISAMTGTALVASDVGRQITVAGANYTIRTYISGTSCTVYSNGSLPVAGTGVAYSVNSFMQFVVYPQPTASTVFVLQGNGDPVEEALVFDSDNMIDGTHNATIPRIFGQACVEYMTYRCMRSAEEFTEQREAIQEAKFEREFTKAKRKWGMLVPKNFWIRNNVCDQEEL